MKKYIPYFDGMKEHPNGQWKLWSGEKDVKRYTFIGEGRMEEHPNGDWVLVNNQ